MNILVNLRYWESIKKIFYVILKGWGTVERFYVNFKLSFYLEINMDKTSQRIVTKDPKRQERGKKSHETYMKRLKEKILEDNQLPTPSSTDRPTPSTSSSTDGPTPSTSSSTDGPTPSTSSSTGNSTSSAPSHATRSSDTYIYGVGILAVLVIGVCVFFACNTFHTKNIKRVNQKQDQPPKRRHIL